MSLKVLKIRISWLLLWMWKVLYRSVGYDFSSYQFVFLVKIFASWARRAIDFRWIFSCGLNENEVYSEANSCRSSAKKARFTRIYRMSKELKNISFKFVGHSLFRLFSGRLLNSSTVLQRNFFVELPCRSNEGYELALSNSFCVFISSTGTKRTISLRGSQSQGRVLPRNKPYSNHT